MIWRMDLLIKGKLGEVDLACSPGPFIARLKSVAFECRRLSPEMARDGVCRTLVMKRTRNYGETPQHIRFDKFTTGSLRPNIRCRSALCCHTIGIGAKKCWVCPRSRAPISAQWLSMLLLRVLPDDAFGSSRPCHPEKTRSPTENLMLRPCSVTKMSAKFRKSRWRWVEIDEDPGTSILHYTELRRTLASEIHCSRLDSVLQCHSKF
jgi:hypothetical protein